MWLPPFRRVWTLDLRLKSPFAPHHIFTTQDTGDGNMVDSLHHLIRTLQPRLEPECLSNRSVLLFNMHCMCRVPINLSFLACKSHLLILINHHLVTNLLNRFLTGNNFCASHSREGRQDLGDIAPPLLSKSLVPINRDGHSIREACLLLPA